MPPLPDGLRHVRTTQMFTHESHPAALLRSHQVAEHVWGRLVVQSGSLRFVFEDQPNDPVSVDAGQSVVIPPLRRHHIEVDGPVSFAIEFHRLAEAGEDSQ